jgi:hypothetical protein
MRLVGSRWQYDVTPDGQRFIVAMRDEVAPPFTVLVHWAAALKAR